MENRPYSSTGNPADEKEDAIIKVDSDFGPQDIASDPSSIASRISGLIPEVVRIYSTKENRINVGNAIAQHYPKLKPLIRLGA